MLYLSPSILSADFANLASDIAAAEEGGADYIHIDVMDGHFVPNITIGYPVLKSLRRATSLPLDVHLMISSPSSYVAAFIEAGADIITFHIESEGAETAEKIISQIRRGGASPSICIKPGSSEEVILPFLPLLDMVLVMTVEPGFGGQAIIPETLEKVTRLRRILDKVNPACRIEVDGGINIDTVDSAISAGADVIVAGSAVFGNGDIALRTRRLKAAMDAALLRTD